ncbi:hypothetical protein AVEN_107158-1 [Araneus ventricosus]|uniref:DDE-1 domain-containing protein n=1 Tax=Araneus ventricosus TaxID=182803 RepID=A0A4Y2MNG2_ARAVE|nr:hypothetical protein AVEN_107158-1 [Araneus ventricosus]
MAIQNFNLPPSFVNEVVKIVEDETIVRSNLKSVSDVYSWIEECGRTSDTKSNLRPSRPSGTRLVCCLDNFWASVSTLLINKSWKNLLPNFIDSEVEENVQTEEIQLASFINQLQNTNPMSNTEVLQWAAEADDNLARN